MCSAKALNDFLSLAILTSPNNCKTSQTYFSTQKIFFLPSQGLRSAARLLPARVAPPPCSSDVRIGIINQLQRYRASSSSSCRFINYHSGPQAVMSLFKVSCHNPPQTCCLINSKPCNYFQLTYTARTNQLGKEMRRSLVNQNVGFWLFLRLLNG